MMGHVLRVAILLLVGTAVATAVNAVRSNGIAWIVSREQIYPPPKPEQVAADITREEVLAAIEQGAVVIDARGEEKYLAAHIPSAVNFPAETAGDSLDRIFEFADVGDFVIVYCGGAECEESREVFDLLADIGFTNLRLYFGGWADWTDAGMPVEE